MKRFHREPLLLQQVTSSKPCKDDSITPAPRLQEIKMIFFGHQIAIGTLEIADCRMAIADLRGGRLLAAETIRRKYESKMTLGICPN